MPLKEIKKICCQFEWSNRDLILLKINLCVDGWLSSNSNKPFVRYSFRVIHKVTNRSGLDLNLKELILIYEVKTLVRHEVYYTSFAKGVFHLMSKCPCYPCNSCYCDVVMTTRQIAWNSSEVHRQKTWNGLDLRWTVKDQCKASKNVWNQWNENTWNCIFIHLFVVYTIRHILYLVSWILRHINFVWLSVLVFVPARPVIEILVPFKSKTALIWFLRQETSLT